MRSWEKSIVALVLAAGKGTRLGKGPNPHFSQIE